MFDAAEKLHIRVGHVAEACDLVIRHHYSKRAPANIQIVATMHDDGGLFGDYGEVVAACFLCIPPTRWTEPVLELSRLVRSDRSIKLTPLISAACRAAKKRGYDLIVSFADKTHGHHGGIYQAASWNYDGARGVMVDGVTIDGKFIPGRSCNSKWGTRSPVKLSERLGVQVLPHYDEGKHLYWKSLGALGSAKASRLGLKKMPYPKPNNGNANKIPRRA